MSKLKTAIALFLSLVLSVAVVSGCTPNGENGGNQNEQAVKNE